MWNIRYSLLFLLTTLATFVLAPSVGVSNSNKASGIDSCVVYQVILSGREASIKNYFKDASYENLSGKCSDEILKAITNLSAKDKITHTIWILEEVKNRSTDIRETIYSTLLKVNYPKPAYLLKPMINSYFTSYRESNDSLAKQVNALHWSMIK